MSEYRDCLCPALSESSHERNMKKEEQVIHFLQDLDGAYAWKEKKGGLLFNKGVILAKIQGDISKFDLMKPSTFTVLKLLMGKSRVIIRH